MNAHGLADELNELLATENRSLGRHLENATPHLTPKTYPIWRKMEHLSAASIDHASRLSDLILKLKLPPRPRTFFAEVANYHFLDLDYLLPKLIAEKRRQIATYGRALTHVGANESLKAALEALKAENDEQLAQLTAFVTDAAA